MMEEPTDPLANGSAKAGVESLRSEKLYALWNLATQHQLGDEGRIQAILAESCKVLGVEIALVGEVIDGQYFIRYAHDSQSRFVSNMELPLAATPCQCVVERGASVFLPDLTGDPVLASLPVVSQLNLQVYCGTPIWVDGQLWGVLAFTGGNQLGEAHAQDNLAFVELVANWVALLQTQAFQRAKLENLVLTDDLTSLPNRRAARARLNEEISRARENKQGFVLALVDLDYFKLVNDRYGHGIGDEVLTSFARRFTQHLRAQDWVARWGGEEFLVCLHTIDLKQAQAIFERLREVMRQQPFVTAAGEIKLTMSVGLCVFDQETDTRDSILANLDNIMYEAKFTGRDKITSDKRSLGMLQTANLLHEASSEKRILVAYQPIVDLTSRQIVADESLARLQTPQGEILSASSFIDAAEGLSLMAGIDSIVADITMKRCAQSLSAGKASPGFAHFINLSPQFLARRDLVETLLLNAQGHCNSCGIEMGPVKPLVFEITERQAIRNLDLLEQDLKYLLDFGFRLALDDFGSGYSSFLYLSRLPISFLKIEGWMIQNMQRNSKVMELVKSMVSFAYNEGITTIAEHVENEETALLLQEIGVDWAQGYYFGRPVLLT